MGRGLEFRRAGFGKKGQFYLIAAIILVTVIIGINVVFNYSKKQDSGGLENLKEEIQIESENVLDYLSYRGSSDSEKDNLLRSFSKDYINSKGKDKNLYFIFGDSSSLTVVASQSLEETAKINVGGGGFVLGITPGTVFEQSFSPSTNEIRLIINGLTNKFEIKEGENFYFLISQEIDGGVYVTKN